MRKIKAAGLTGVKFYTSMNPSGSRRRPAEAHELGLHVHGHIPAGMRTLDAVNAGYDEITHIYFATMQAMPQEVVDKSNTTLRMTGPASYFKDVDLNAEPMTATSSRRWRKARSWSTRPWSWSKACCCPTPAPSARPTRRIVGTMPPATERGFKCGPAAAARRHHPRRRPRELRQDGSNMSTMLRDAGVPIVAGTDGCGIELVRELELYVEGGMTTGRGAGDRDHRRRAQRRRRQAHRLDRGRQGSRPGAGRRRRVEATSATCAMSTRW